MHTENLKSPRAPRRDHAPSRLRVAVSLQFLIATGDGLAGVALAVRVYQQTHSPWAVTAVLLAAGLPVVLLAPLAGMLLDRVRIGFALVPAAAGMAVAAVGLSMVHGLVATVALVALYGTGDSLLRPGLGAAVPLLAGPGGLIRANSALSAATMSGTALGPLFAGVVSSAGGTRLALLMDAGAYAIAALGLATLRLGRSHVPSTTAPARPGAPCRPASPTCAPTGRCAPSSWWSRSWSRLPTSRSSPSSSSPRARCTPARRATRPSSRDGRRP